jgi:hypothetical protein
MEGKLEKLWRFNEEPVLAHEERQYWKGRLSQTRESTGPAITGAGPCGSGNRVPPSPEAESDMYESNVQSSVLVWLVRSGGWPLLLLGLVFAAVGVLLMVIRPSRVAVVVHALLSLLPALIGLFAVYAAASDYSGLASSPSPPKPTEFAEVTGRAMSFSFFGLLGTLLASFFAVLALSRLCFAGPDEAPHVDSLPE